MVDEKILSMCKNLGISNGKLSEEYLFTIKNVDLFYFKGNIGEIDIKAGFTDGANDGGIDFIYTDQDSLYLIQGKSGDNLSLDDIKHLFTKIKTTVNDFDNKNYDKYSSVLKSTYLNAIDSLSPEMNIEFVLFSNVPIDSSMRKEIQNYVSENLSEYTITCYDINDIKNQEIIQTSELIEEDSLKLYMNETNKYNCLAYGDDGIIVNIMATSLHELYIKKAKKGLFNFNLREHVSQKNVDDGIDSTIKNQPENFWYYNNGITIGCGDFNIDGNKLKLYNFSIINGAQTTTKIGLSKFIDQKNDFPIVCKVVRASNMRGKDADFINKISEASNSQKPIKFRDLKSNSQEQKMLQRGCAQNSKPLAVEIKRGVNPDNYKKVEPWQRISNEYLGQLIYACILQKAGPARNAKNAIFMVPKVYNQVFKRKVDYNTLYDIVWLGKIYDDFSKKFVDSPAIDIDDIAVVKNGKFTILGILFYLIKKQRNIVKNYLDEGLYKDNISGFIISQYPEDDLEQKVNDLFTFLIRHLKHLYEQKKETLKLTSYSNFFKSEQYYELVLKSIDELDNYDIEKINTWMIVFKNKESI